MEVDYPETDWEWTLPRADGAIGQALDALDADIANLTALWENTSQEWRESEEGVETKKWIFEELPVTREVMYRTTLAPSFINA